MTNDPRYNQARQLQQSMMQRNNGNFPDRNSFQGTQMHQLRAQIMAYRFLARNQPLPPTIVAAVSGRRDQFGQGMFLFCYF